MVGLASPKVVAWGQNVLWLHCSLLQAVRALELMFSQAPFSSAPGYEYEL